MCEDLGVYCELVLVKLLREGPTLRPPHAVRRLSGEKTKRRPQARIPPNPKGPRKLSARNQGYLRAIQGGAETYRWAHDFVTLA